MKIGDIDIDVKSHTDKSRYGIRAIIYDEEKLSLRPHPSGYYFESNMPVDPETGFSAIDYEDAEESGFQKLDLLTNASYDVFNSKQEVLDTLKDEPDWDLLLDESFVKTLPHIANHFELVYRIKPKSVMELADTLALIRPGKSHLIDDYLKDKERVRPNLYRRPKKGFRFKKSHAVAYAVMITCVMHKRDIRNLLIY